MESTARAIVNAEPKFQLPTCMNWFSIIFPIITESVPPSIAGIANEPRAGIKTKSVPAKIPVRLNLKVMSKNALAREAPRSNAASVNELSIFNIDA